MDVVKDLESRGAEVHYEQIKIDVPKPVEAGVDYAAVAKYLGLVDQFSGLTYEDTWKRTDMLLSEVLAHVVPAEHTVCDCGCEPADHEPVNQVGAYIANRPMTPRKQRLARKLLAIILPVAARVKSRGSLGAPPSIVLNHRNQIAAQAAITASGDVVALWGAAHIPGIGKLLREAGFTRTKRSWATAIESNN
jgi:hypothetical protein